ncbi:hypothetical protein QYF36_020323 [Acer negundo]|nr:hypothetical protein QYF36_020323 [Acer negundo]
MTILPFSTFEINFSLFALNSNFLWPPIPIETHLPSPTQATVSDVHSGPIVTSSSRCRRRRQYPATVDGIRRRQLARRRRRQYPATVDGIRRRQLARRRRVFSQQQRRVFESSRSEQHADVVNLSSSSSESASSLRSGNISSIWVQFQV